MKRHEVRPLDWKRNERQCRTPGLNVPADLCDVGFTERQERNGRLS